MNRASSRLTYANVISTICLFLVLGGGAAFAAGKLGKNTVGSKQLKKNAVTTAKLKNASVTTAKLKDGGVDAAKLADGAVNGAKVADGSLTGADIDQSSLTGVRAANVSKIALSNDADCSPTQPLPAGVSASRQSEGVCALKFPAPLSSCALSATVHLRNLGGVVVFAKDRTAYVSEFTASPGTVLITTLFEGTKTALPVDLIVVC
jgi:hypothetical protein